MALIPTNPKHQKLLIVAVALTAAFYAFHSFLYSPKKAEADEMAVRLEQLSDQNQRAQIIAMRGGRELQERLALYERHIQQLERLIPANEEVPALLDDITVQARQNEVDVALMRPEPAEASSFYTKQSYAMGVVGSYHDVGRFLSAVASLPRIVTAVDLDIAPAEEPQQAQAPAGTTLVVANFRIETYVLPSQGGGASAPGQGQGQTPPAAGTPG